jgi:glycosyltransferase involved in cell wall biosynthesis
MRVLHCIWRMGVGGAERQLGYLTTGLVHRGIDVHVATVYGGDNDHILKAASHRLAAAGKYDPLLLPRLIRLCRQLRPDVVHTWLTQMDILGGAAAEVLSIPWVLSERSTGAAYPPSLLHRIRARIGSRADAIVANSNGGREYWRQFVKNGTKIELIPNIVPNDEIDAAPILRGEWDEEEIVLYVGRFSAEKNLERLLQALTAVMKHRKTKAVFCGDGSMRPAIEQRARELGIADRTRFLGSVDNVWSWMKCASAVVAASVFEGNPNAVLEAMACGTPLVVSDIAAHRDLLNEQCAWIVDPQSIDSIAEGLLAVLGDRAEATARAAMSRAAITARSTYEIAARYESVYNEVLLPNHGRAA